MYFQPSSQEPSSERVMLITVHSNYGYAHVIARVVRRAQKTYTNAAGRTIYGDDNSIGYRNCEWSSSLKSAIYTKDLEIRNQISLDSADRTAYGEGYRFQDVYSIDNLQQMNVLSNTFKVLEKGLDKQRKESGIHVQDIECLIERIAAVLKIKTFAVRTDNSTTLCTNAYREFSVSEVREEVYKLELSVR